MSDIAPVYFLLAVLPVVAFWKHGSRSTLRALSIVVLAHLGPLAGLFMGAALFGQARSHNYLGWLHFALFIISIAVVVMATRPLRPFIPEWAFILFLAGVAIMNLFAFFLGGMALADDWV